MKRKSYFAGSVEAAMSLASQELGAEAMLVHSTKSTPATHEWGEYEVVSAVLDLDSVTTPARMPRPHTARRDMATLHRQLARTASALTKVNRLTSPKVCVSPRIEKLFIDLLSAEFDVEVAREIVARMSLDEDLGNRGLLFSERLAQALESQFAVDSQLGREGSRRKFVAFIGPTGSGKTTSLVKLAARYRPSAGLSVHILSLDTYRIAAVEQLRCYSAILGIGFEVVESPFALARSLQKHDQTDLIFIDTPGYVIHDLENGAELAHFLSSHEDMDTHLVLPASMRGADLSQAAAQYDVFRPRKLLFTKLDETESFGALVNQAARSQLPMSFLANGQRAPEDIAPAIADDLIELLLRRTLLVTEPVAATTAAA